MKHLKLITAILAILLFCSCSVVKITDSEIEKLNGLYNATTYGHNEEHVDRTNFVRLLNRKILKDTLRDASLVNYLFRLKILDKKLIQINIYNEHGAVSSRKYKFRKGEDCIVLKNKNIRFILVPYLAGALDVTKLKLKSAEDGSLSITANEHRSGGFLMVPMGWSNFEGKEKYSRIE